LFEATLARLDGMAGAGPPTIITGKTHLELVDEAVARSRVEPGLVIVEPSGRNTGPAVAAAALAAEESDVLVLLPSDHVISDVSAFRGHIDEAVDLARSGWIVTFGVAPDRAETGYGYIEMGEPIGAGRRVVRFKEKPSALEAEALSTDGSHLWNSGIFVGAVSTLVAEMERTCPEILDAVRSALGPVDAGVMELAPSFTSVEAISFDYAVMERTALAAVIPIDVGWDDVGSYQALMSHVDTDRDGNFTTGDVVLEDVTGSFIHAGSRRVAVSGLSDVVVVETPEAVLVVPLSQAQRVKTLAEHASDSE
jgi:mannose-1-phosphate guanylyltransferase/mannose-6-phosphate isomerase